MQASRIHLRPDNNPGSLIHICWCIFSEAKPEKCKISISFYIELIEGYSPSWDMIENHKVLRPYLAITFASYINL